MHKGTIRKGNVTTVEQEEWKSEIFTVVYNHAFCATKATRIHTVQQQKTVVTHTVSFLFGSIRNERVGG